MDGICYFASMTLSLDTTFTYITGKLTRYLNTYLGLEQFLLLEEMDRTVEAQGVPRLQSVFYPNQFN